MHIPDVKYALDTAQQGYFEWRQQHVYTRAHVLEVMADKLQQNSDELLSLCCLEGGKTIEDGIAEIQQLILSLLRVYARTL